ncbi:MAG: DUF1097 domain-containing protein [Anaerolineales bacterium]|nr:DUF1097 domain-containing protein [Anaerolineales bacterium]
MKTKPTIPFWLAVVITALLPLPLGMYLGNWNIPLWVSFIVWAQYFVYGSNPAAFGKILGPFAAGALFSTAGMVLAAVFGTFIGSPLIATALGFGIAVAVMVGIMPKVPLFQECSLAYFNGMAMMLGVYFTGSHPYAGALTPVMAPIVAGIWAIISGWIGSVFGWFNVVITFPREIKE